MAKVLATFRLEEKDWKAFHEWADSQKSTATRELTRFVLASIGKLDEKLDSELEERFNGIQDAIAALVAKMESLEERLKPLEGMAEKKSESPASSDDLSLGLTDKELSERLGVSKQAVSFWKHGKRNPSGKNKDFFSHWDFRNGRWFEKAIPDNQNSSL